MDPEWEAQMARKKESQKQWYIKNRERLNAKAKQYFADNKPRLKKQSLETVQCPLCRSTLRRGSLSHHKGNAKCVELQSIRLATGQKN